MKILNSILQNSIRSAFIICLATSTIVGLEILDRDHISERVLNARYGKEAVFNEKQQKILREIDFSEKSMRSNRSSYIFWQLIDRLQGKKGENQREAIALAYDILTWTAEKIKAVFGIRYMTYREMQQLQTSNPKAIETVRAIFEDTLKGVQEVVKTNRSTCDSWAWIGTEPDLNGKVFTWAQSAYKALKGPNLSSSEQKFLQSQIDVFEDFRSVLEKAFKDTEGRPTGSASFNKEVVYSPISQAEIIPSAIHLGPSEHEETKGWNKIATPLEKQPIASGIGWPFSIFYMLPGLIRG